MGDLRTEAEEAVKAALKRFPSLNSSGIDGPDGSGPISVDEVVDATRWLAQVGRTKKAHARYGDSYGLKHEAERWARRYISNGAFIAAAVGLGFQVVPTGRNGLINIADRRRWPQLETRL